MNGIIKVKTTRFHKMDTRNGSRENLSNLVVIKGAKQTQ
jgi:hypothetical protein